MGFGVAEVLLWVAKLLNDLSDLVLTLIAFLKLFQCIVDESPFCATVVLDVPKTSLAEELRYLGARVVVTNDLGYSLQYR